MIIVTLWTLFGLLGLAVVGCIIAAIIGWDSYSHDGFCRRRRRWFPPVAVACAALMPLAAWGAAYFHAEAKCEARGGEFITYANAAGWDCLLPEDFGPLTYDQNFRLDITGQNP